MSPAESANSVAHGLDVDAEVHSEFAIRFAGGVSAAAFEDLLSGELRVTGTRAVPAFAVPVGHVVGVGTDEQVLGIHTWRVVAPVQDVKPWRDRAVRNFPRRAVRANQKTIQFEKSVASDMAFGLPQPASAFGFLDLAPESRDRPWFHTRKRTTPHPVDTIA